MHQPESSQCSSCSKRWRKRKRRRRRTAKTGRAAGRRWMSRWLGRGEAAWQRTLPFKLLHGHAAKCCTKVHYCIPPFSAIGVRGRSSGGRTFTGQSSAAQRLSSVSLHPGNSPSVSSGCVQDLDSQTQLGRDILIVSVWAEHIG